MKLLVLFLGFLHVAVAMPVLQDLEMVDDTMSVGTIVREARAAPPENFHKTYESEGDGEIGYSRKKTGGGKKGYQHFDSYHKKAGDNYELETQDSYGQDEEGHEGAHSHPQEKRERYREAEREDDEREKDGNIEKDHEELREGADNGNGGVEAYGHDPADYVLPEKYTYESYHEADSEDEKQKKAKNSHKDHEELREGADNGNGGVEAQGHNPADYVLPEKYTYGSGDEYDF